MSTDFHRRLPGKSCAAGALITDEAGRVLLVEPTYKSYWDLPGGIVEADESPWAAMQREVKEELGLIVEAGRLLVVDYIPSRGQLDDAFRFVFDGGEISADTAIQLDDAELRSWAWCTEPEMLQRTRNAPLLARRILAAWHALYDERVVYLEAGLEVGQ